ncbi:CPBP family intramembrane glutamic endopeptidase [Lactiplantibacillus carotarum]|uniref:CPBP family intramembrane glutamic endopeptidase n=1 Tax=Lactiplantibacillus carotarum TaxID=2993456 RepID=UPI00298F2179|nr:type II CAAX endopeptidase family protein [Lactiplantibacillus carotarum]
MALIDRGLSLLWRLMIMVGLIVGILIPPMLLRLINELANTTHPWSWQVASVIAYFMVFGLVILAGSATTRHYTGTYALKPMTRRDLWLVVGAYLVIIGLESGFELINRIVYHQTQTQNNAAIKSLMSGSSLALWMMGLSAIFLTPIAEELVFRGALTNLFFQHNWLKILLSGLVFGSLHSSSTLPSFMIYVMMGLVLAGIYRFSGKIQDAILLHFLINLAAMSLMLGQIVSG